METYVQILEGKSVDSKYLLKSLKDGMQDIRDDKDLTKIIKSFMASIQKDFPDEDVTEKEMLGILNDKEHKKMIKKAKSSASDILWWIMNGV